MKERMNYWEGRTDWGLWGLSIIAGVRKGHTSVKGRIWGHFSVMIGPFSLTFMSLPIDPFTSGPPEGRKPKTHRRR